jgi:hypothetical protein
MKMLLAIDCKQLRFEEMLKYSYVMDIIPAFATGTEISRDYYPRWAPRDLIN